jgi:hypothetical protein
MLHHTLLQSENWTACETWYTCELSFAIPSSYTELFDKLRSHEIDFHIATKLCGDQVVFWAVGHLSPLSLLQAKGGV